MREYRVASIIQVLSFTMLIGPFLTFEKVVIPVTTTIYSAAFWLVYYTAPECDILLYEAAFKFICYILLIFSVAYVSKVCMWTAFNNGNDLLNLIKDSHSDGLIIIEKNDKIKYCNPGAKKMLGLPETDFLETLSKTKFVNEGGVTIGFSKMLS